MVGGGYNVASRNRAIVQSLGGFVLGAIGIPVAMVGFAIAGIFGILLLGVRSLFALGWFGFFVALGVGIVLFGNIRESTFGTAAWLVAISIVAGTGIATLLWDARPKVRGRFRNTIRAWHIGALGSFCSLFGTFILIPAAAVLDGRFLGADAPLWLTDWHRSFAGIDALLPVALSPEMMLAGWLVVAGIPFAAAGAAIGLSLAFSTGESVRRGPRGSPTVFGRTLRGQQSPAGASPSRGALRPDGIEVIQHSIRMSHVATSTMAGAELSQSLGPALDSFPRGVVLEGPAESSHLDFALAACGEHNRPLIVVDGAAMAYEFEDFTVRKITGLFELALEKTDSAVLLLNAHKLLGRPDEMDHSNANHWTQSFLRKMDIFGQPGNQRPIILSTDDINQLHPDVAASGIFGAAIRVPEFDEKERFTLMRRLLADQTTEPLDYEVLVSLTAGWSRRDFVDLQASLQGKPSITTPGVLQAMIDLGHDIHIPPEVLAKERQATAPPWIRKILDLVGHDAPAIAIDVMNLAKIGVKEGADFARVHNLATLLQSYGMHVHGVVDSPLYGVLTSAPDQQALLQECLDQGDGVWEQVQGTEADEVALEWADYYGGFIASNDKFRDYHDEHPWLVDQPHRALRARIHPSGELRLYRSDKKKVQAIKKSH